MRERFDVRLLVLQAGAGFGKSTLVRQALAENLAEPRGIDVVVECTADDAHLLQFAGGSPRCSTPRGCRSATR